jgi:hypothetical protein
MEDYDARGEGFSRAMTGEKVNHLALLKNRDQLVRLLNDPGFLTVPDEQRSRLLQYVNQAGPLQAEQEYFQTSFRHLLSARQAAFPDRLKTAVVAQECADKAASRGLLLNALFWDGLTGFVNREASGLANLRLALTAVALEQFRAAHPGRYPAALSELTPNYLPAPLLDPFDGKPLRYRQKGAGYVLYSVGPNLKGDGGKRQNGNLMFTVITPPPS